MQVKIRSVYYTYIISLTTPTATPSQTNEADILANTCGSSGFQEFLSGLGNIIRLTECVPDLTYLGGLDRGGSDGEFTYIYHDDITQGKYYLILFTHPPPPLPLPPSLPLHISGLPCCYYDAHSDL